MINAVRTAGWARASGMATRRHERAGRFGMGNSPTVVVAGGADRPLGAVVGSDHLTGAPSRPTAGRGLLAVWGYPGGSVVLAEVGAFA